MKCQKCNQREANTHITKIINGVKTEIYLCSECADESGELISFKTGLDSDFENFFSGFFLGNNHEGSMKSIGNGDKRACSLCGTTLNDILKCGRLGCSECYRIFGEYLIRPLKQIHGASRHTGKIPHRCGSGIRRSAELEKLQSQLSRAVMEQNFEKAAELRDKINAIKENKEG